MTEPDFTLLTKINDTFDEIVEAGTATQDDFDRLLAEAEAAVGPNGGEFLEGLLMRGTVLGFYKP